MFENVDGRTTTTDDGRRIHGYPISSPSEPKGSGKLKTCSLDTTKTVPYGRVVTSSDFTALVTLYPSFY